MPWTKLTITKKEEYLIIYIVTRGIWIRGEFGKKLVPASDIYETKEITVTATDPSKAKAIASKELYKARIGNDYIKIVKVIPIPEKKTAV